MHVPRPRRPSGSLISTRGGSPWSSPGPVPAAATRPASCRCCSQVPADGDRDRLRREPNPVNADRSTGGRAWRVDAPAQLPQPDPTAVTRVGPTQRTHRDFVADPLAAIGGTSERRQGSLLVNLFEQLEGLHERAFRSTSHAHAGRPRPALAGGCRNQPPHALGKPYTLRIGDRARRLVRVHGAMHAFFRG
jgi:hypothetical protein